jgi:RimJ/RimL family protein N-acetyltransferase
MEIIEADINHCKLLFKWRNEYHTRMNSFSSKPINLNEHKDWFQKRLKSYNSKVWILYKSKMPIGQIRIEKNKNNKWEIDYSIEKKNRGMGYGKYLISWCVENHSDKTLMALVKEENTISRRIFENLDFIVIKKENNIYHYVRYSRE